MFAIGCMFCPLINCHWNGMLWWRDTSRNSTLWSSTLWTGILLDGHDGPLIFDMVFYELIYLWCNILRIREMFCSMKLLFVVLFWLWCCVCVFSLCLWWFFHVKYLSPIMMLQKKRLCKMLSFTLLPLTLLSKRL